MAQQTAVEWFEEKYHYLLVEADINDMHVVEFDKKRNELFDQAKAMEKQQITIAYNNGVDDAYADEYKEMDDYYDKIYNK